MVPLSYTVCETTENVVHVQSKSLAEFLFYSKCLFYMNGSELVTRKRAECEEL